jgi:hypothetical protein
MATMITASNKAVPFINLVIVFEFLSFF